MHNYIVPLSNNIKELYDQVDQIALTVALAKKTINKVIYYILLNIFLKIHTTIDVKTLKNDLMN